MKTKRNHSLAVKPLAPVQPPRVVTRDELVARAKEAIEFDIAYAERSTKEELGKWIERFGKDPADALSWSSGVFTAAARHKQARIVREYVDLVTKNRTTEYGPPSFYEVLCVIRDEIRREVLRKAKWPEHSTSVPSNEMSLQMNAAAAEWLEKIEGSIARIDEVK